MNFELCLLGPDAMKRMQHQIQDLTQFKEWDDMQVRDDLLLNEDYYAISVAAWSKLITLFGGAPTIPVFQYKQLDELKHDFQPVKVKVSLVEQYGEISSKSCLISRHMTPNQVVAYLGGLHADFQVKASLYLVDPDNLATKIIKVANGQTLDHAGLQHDICLYHTS